MTTGQDAMLDTEAPPGTEATADAPQDGTTRPPKPCRFCQVPVQQPKRWDREKDFCSDRHRTAFHTAERRQEVQNLMNALEDLAGNLEQMGAAALGFRARLAATLPKDRTKKKT